MIRVRYNETLNFEVRKVVPWVRENPLKEVLETRRKEALQIVELIAQREREALKELPREVQELINIPDVNSLLGEM
ncbi:hypothetical protein [Thermococcus sp.]